MAWDNNSEKRNQIYQKQDFFLLLICKHFPMVDGIVNEYTEWCTEQECDNPKGDLRLVV